MFSNYIITSTGAFVSEDELYHYGIPGMKLGHRKQKLIDNANISRESAKEWNEMAKYAMAKGKTKRAAKYKKNAAKDLADARKYEKKATEGNKKSAKKNTANGKKKAKTALQKTARASLKTTNYIAQVGLRALQNYGNMQRIKYWSNDL